MSFTAKQRAFVDHYLITLNGTEAARRARYQGDDNTLGVVAHENLRKEYIKDEIERRLRDTRATVKQIDSALKIGRANNRSAILYLIQEDFNGLVKIGVTTDVVRRCKSLQTSCPQALTILAAFRLDEPREIEAELHARYSERHFRGEWFRLSDDDIDEIKTLLEGGK